MTKWIARTLTIIRSTENTKIAQGEASTGLVEFPGFILKTGANNWLIHFASASWRLFIVDIPIPRHLNSSIKLFWSL
jgi:hypothetical protein